MDTSSVPLGSTEIICITEREIVYSLFLQVLSSAFSSSEFSHVVQETFPSSSVQTLHPSAHTGSGLTEIEREREGACH